MTSVLNWRSGWEVDLPLNTRCWSPQGLCLTTEEWTTDKGRELYVKFIENPYPDPWGFATPSDGVERILVRRSIFPVDPVAVSSNGDSYFPEPGYPWMGKPHLVVLHYHIDASTVQGEPYWMFMVHGFNYSTREDFWMAYEGVSPGGASRWTSVGDYKPSSNYFADLWRERLAEEMRKALTS